MDNKCSLCGGRLRNGICIECGMDNRKSDEAYKNILNQSDCQNRSLTHVHEDKQEQQGEKKAQDSWVNLMKLPEPRKTSLQQRSWQKPQPNSVKSPQQNSVQNSVQNPGYSQAGSRTRQTTQQTRRTENTGNLSGNQNRSYQQPYTGYTYTNVRGKRVTQNKNVVFKTVCITALAVFFILFIIGSIIPDTYLEDDLSVENYPLQDDFDFSDPYTFYGQEQIPAGEYWEQDLTAGVYMVGVDIPEGEYTLKGDSGASFYIENRELSMYESKMFGTEEYQITEIAGIPLYNGTMVILNGFPPVTFTTENAQVGSLEKRIDNSLTEAVELSGSKVAGKDFLPGTYDVEVAGENFGVLQIEVPLSDREYPFGMSVLMEQSPTEEYPDYCSVFRNVVLPEGAAITAEDFTVILKPSEGIVSEDYTSFYNNIF